MLGAENPRLDGLGNGREPSGEQVGLRSPMATIIPAQVSMPRMIPMGECGPPVAWRLKSGKPHRPGENHLGRPDPLHHRPVI